MLPAQPGPELQPLLHLPPMPSTSLLQLPRHSFDLIFLDANKEGYQSYYNTILDCHLLAPGGLLVVDNTLMKVCVFGGELGCRHTAVRDVGAHRSVSACACSAHFVQSVHVTPCAIQRVKL